LVPYDITQIFDRWPGWADLNKENAKGIFEVINKLIPLGREKGFLTDNTMMTMLKPYLPKDTFTLDELKLEQHKFLETLFVNRWRATVLGNTHVREQRNLNIQRKKDIATAAENKRKEKAAAKLLKEQQAEEKAAKQLAKTIGDVEVVTTTLKAKKRKTGDAAVSPTTAPKAKKDCQKAAGRNK
jgi:hypothetical protein